jgi:Family of unknown function (DUF5995)
MLIQIMKRLFLILVLFFFVARVLPQVNNGEIPILLKLDSLTHQNTAAKHFAKLYAETFTKTVFYFNNEKQRTKELAHRFETTLAGFFFTAAALAYKNINSWQTYFADTALTPFQYQLLGINAHINGDIWQALTKEFSLSELIEFKPTYLSFLKKEMLQQYNDFYTNTALTVAKVKALHLLSFGLSKNFGRQLLKRWGLRQLKLAFIYHKNPEKFTRKRKNLNRKTNHLNWLILRNF